MIPKIELHLHLEGAAPPAFIRDLSKEKAIDISGIFAEDGGYRFRDFAEFLKVYEAATSVLTTPRDYARLTQAVLEKSAASAVVYAETFISPEFCGGGDPGAWRDYLAAIQDAAQISAQQGGPELRGIVTCIRHFDPQKARAAALCAAETAGEFICGFGIGGNETVPLAKDFHWAFDCAREAGLHLTAHAGEFAGPDSIREAINVLGVARVGHGVRAIEDLALVDELAEREIVLEVCPGSNIALGLYPTLRHHPIGELDRRGVKVTVSTDDPPFFRTTMSQEYENLHRAFEWDEAQFARINRTALDAAFCGDDIRAKIAKQLERP